MTRGTPASSQIIFLEQKVAELEAENEKLKAKLWQATGGLGVAAVLDDILNYTGGANNALEDEYVMERIRAAMGGKDD